MALDTYFRGNSQEVEFCKKIRAGGNHLVVTTAGGRLLGAGSRLRLRSKELKPVLDEYRALPGSERRPRLEDPALALPPRRATPTPPPDGLVIRGYCTYLGRENGALNRVTRYYYEENPDRWAAETQSDMLWLTETEWRSLVPVAAAVGDVLEVASPVRRRFFSTIGIDYMEGSVNSLAPRETTLELTVETATKKGMALRLDGYGRMGEEFDEKLRSAPRSRGCEIRVLGKLHYDIASRTFDRFDIVGVGKAWGNKMNYVKREIRSRDYPWTYGIACELVRTRSPIDLIPPYNLLHYGSAGPYFAAE